VGEEKYVYGFPLVMMDVTREVVTAVWKAGEYAAPINQFGRIRTYVNPVRPESIVSSKWAADQARGGRIKQDKYCIFAPIVI